MKCIVEKLLLMLSHNAFYEFLTFFNKYCYTFGTIRVHGAGTPVPVTPVWIRPWPQHIPSAQLQQTDGAKF